MTDYKSMYYHLAGRTATAVDILEASTEIMEGMEGTLEALKATADCMDGAIEALKATTLALESIITATNRAIVGVKDKLKMAQQITEEMFMNGDNQNSNE